MDQTDGLKTKRRPGDPVPSSTSDEDPVASARIASAAEEGLLRRDREAHESARRDATQYDGKRRDGKRRRKAKRGSSRPARRFEDIEKRISKAMRRVTKAVNRGMSQYQDSRDRSASKRRDGALVDLYENASKGVSRAIADSTPVLVDVSKAFNTKRSRRRIRKTLRRFPRIPFLV